MENSKKQKRTALTLVFQALPWGWTNKHSGFSKPEPGHGADPSFPSEDNHQTRCAVDGVLGDNATVLPAEAAEEAEGAVATARPHRPPGAAAPSLSPKTVAPHISRTQRRSPAPPATAPRPAPPLIFLGDRQAARLRLGTEQMRHACGRVEAS